MSIARNGLWVDLIETDDAVTVVAAGELDGGNTEFLADFLAAAGALPAAGVIVDLYDLELLTAAGLGVFVRFADELLRTGKWLQIKHPSSDAQRMLEVAGLDWLLRSNRAPSGFAGYA